MKRAIAGYVRVISLKAEESSQSMEQQISRLKKMVLPMYQRMRQGSKLIYSGFQIGKPQVHC
ncbi:hypothetical protein [Trichocoleus sp. FACHB-262]|uniref:hypothetical protein n=1 Tax=Trichocoleus sp. FACHB-262 TaxID=2692869 RepID=UPI0016835976|nr:hypothetical protein [Trichocoleus sp. FACHB-262]MBD2122358.1 hypothetical protein [Trichocoleus sp. FACHB-262]